MLGIIALDQIKRTRQDGYAIAVAGIVIGVATLIIALIVGIFAVHSISGAAHHPSGCEPGNRLPRLCAMASVNRVYVARLARMLVLGPIGENFGRVRDVVISISIVRKQPRVLGLVVDLATRRSIFIPILRVAAIEPNAVTLSTGSVSLRHFEQRPGEVLAIGQVLDTPVTVNDPELPELVGLDVVITDLGIEQSRTRDWLVTRVAVRTQRRWAAADRCNVVDWQSVHGIDAIGVGDAGAGGGSTAQPIRRTPRGRRGGRHPRAAAQAAPEVFKALGDDRLADILQELPESEQAEALSQLGTDRAADLLEEMDPDDAADLLGVLNPTDAELLLARMDPGESAPVRRLLNHSPDTAGGLMTSDPVVLTADTTVAEALARARDSDLTPALSSMVFVTRPPTATPTGQLSGLRAITAAAPRTPERVGRRESSTAICSPWPRKPRWHRSLATSPPTTWSAGRWSTTKTICWAR